MVACLFRRPGHQAVSVLLGLAAGIMLVAALHGLLLPAFELGGPAQAVIGLALGGALMGMLAAALPRRASERGMLLIAALTMHNVPEGLAVGLGFAAAGPETGIQLAVAIGIQNVPEGLAAAAFMLPRGVKRRTAVGVGSATGMVEPPAAFAALAASEQIEAGLPLALAFAAGAMLVVTIRDLIPASLALSRRRGATAIAAGGALLLVLDVGLG